jgi:hypothetical protein
MEAEGFRCLKDHCGWRIWRFVYPGRLLSEGTPEGQALRRRRGQRELGEAQGEAKEEVA